MSYREKVGNEMLYICDSTYGWKVCQTNIMELQIYDNTNKIHIYFYDSIFNIVYDMSMNIL
jgi:hypothetical protein